MKINEYIDFKSVIGQKDILKEIKSGIFLDDDVWSFPCETYNKFLEKCGIKIPSDFQKVAKIIVDKMNEYQVNPNNWEESFDSIIQEITTL